MTMKGSSHQSSTKMLGLLIKSNHDQQIDKISVIPKILLALKILILISISLLKRNKKQVILRKVVLKKVKIKNNHKTKSPNMIRMQTFSIVLQILLLKKDTVDLGNREGVVEAKEAIEAEEEVEVAVKIMTGIMTLEVEEVVGITTVGMEEDTNLIMKMDLKS